MIKAFIIFMMLSSGAIADGMNYDPLSEVYLKPDCTPVQKEYFYEYPEKQTVVEQIAEPPVWLFIALASAVLCLATYMTNKK